MPQDNDFVDVRARLPMEVAESLEETCSECGFIYAKKPSYMKLLEAIGQLDPEDVYNLLEDNDLLPSTRGPLLSVDNFAGNGQIVALT